MQTGQLNPVLLPCSAPHLPSLLHSSVISPESTASGLSKADKHGWALCSLVEYQAQGDHFTRS